jgi:DNA polymerase III delta prime subunit
MNETVSHHATLVYADSLEEANLPPQYAVQSADVLHIVRDQFSIGDARELSELSASMPVSGETRVFVIAARTLASEAQNALLKLFEEPPRSARFVLVLPHSSSLLPTLRSRLSVETSAAPQQMPNTAFEAFKKATYAARLASVAEIAKNKDAHMIEAILKGAEYEADATRNKELLAAVVFARSYAALKGSSLKMLLEAIALSLR